MMGWHKKQYLPLPTAQDDEYKIYPPMVCTRGCGWVYKGYSLSRYPEMQPIKNATPQQTIINTPCAIYPHLPAVLKENGIFLPSWKAQAEGYTLIKVKYRWLQKLLLKHFGV